MPWYSPPALKCQHPASSLPQAVAVLPSKQLGLGEKIGGCPRKRPCGPRWTPESCCQRCCSSGQSWQLGPAAAEICCVGAVAPHWGFVDATQVLVTRPNCNRRRRASRAVAPPC